MKSAVQPFPIARGSTRDISWEFSKWLNEGETITAADVEVSAGLTLVTSGIADSNKRVDARVSVPEDAALGASLWALCKPTTSTGEIEPRKYLFVVKAK